MTVAISVVSADGIVLAADSRTSFHASTPESGSQARVLSDFTRKVFQIGNHAVAIYGTAFINERNIAGHMAELQREDGIAALSVEELGGRIAKFFGDRLDVDLDGQEVAGTALGFLIGGYHDGVAQNWEVGLPSRSNLQLHSGGTGAAWRGQTDVIRRIVKGCDLDLLQAMVAQDGKQPSYAELEPLIKRMEYVIPFSGMNLQDAIDFAVLAIRTTIDVQRLTFGVVAATQPSWPGVGGPIEIAAVSSEGGFRWVQRTALQGERPAGVAELI